MSKLRVRPAEPDDISRLADLDIQLFRGAYGTRPPEHVEVASMLARRLAALGSWMLVGTVDGSVEAFTSGFPTATPAEAFRSWEHSTNHGTAEGCVDASGRYIYVINLTASRTATLNGVHDMLLAHLFARGIARGVPYGYFVSRMPYFARWLRQQQGDVLSADADLDGLAAQYARTRDAKGRRIDAQLRMYEQYGFELGVPTPRAFADAASLDYGVVCKAWVPTRHRLLRHAIPARRALALALRLTARSPRLLQRVA